ncbi:MAG: HDOD domain-containing protein [Acidimicrobiia bacterium]|nr:HDOD domain-containing protein [Acidimicrobiia bacterium]
MTKCFVGRQPIFDGENDVYAYELLYRDSLSNEVGAVNRSVATARTVIDSFVEVGLENVVGQRPAFLNVDESFLIDPGLVSFPSDRVVLELHELIGATPQTVEAIDRLKGLGYRIALDGYRRALPVAELLEYADIVKIDASRVDEESLAVELASLQGADVTLIAKNVETRERRDMMAAAGFDYFQGHYLCRPQIIVGERLPANRVAILELVSKICDPNIEFDELEQLITMDAALSVRILRFVNSPLSGLTNEVDSIHQAIVMVGRNIIRNWVMLLAMASLNDTIPELVTAALVRARICEQLASAENLPSQDSFFTVGLFSLMDAMMSRPMPELLEDLPFTDEVKAALIDRGGVRGQAIRCAQLLEEGATETIEFGNLESDQIAQIYLDAIRWADQTVAGV